MPLLEIDGLSVRYGAHLAVETVTFSVEQSASLAILGANGAGKSTLMNTIAGHQSRAATGSIRFDNQDVTARPGHERAELGIALVPQNRGLFGRMSVSENLELGRYPRRARSTASHRDRVLAYFPRLAERLSQPVNTMSGGEQQMVAIGRALMSAPRLLMLDEPSLGLAPIMTSELFRALDLVVRDGTTLLISEQNAVRTLKLVEAGLLIVNGRVLRRDSAARLLADRSVAEAFLGM